MQRSWGRALPGNWRNNGEACVSGAGWAKGREARAGRGPAWIVLQGCAGLRDDVGFYPGRWEPWRALGRGGWDLAQVLMGTIWWLLREGQTEGRSRVTKAKATALVQGELGCWSWSA